MTSLDRFLAKIEVSPTGCWLWRASLNHKGYGEFQADGYRLAHRWAYASFVGPIPAGFELDHVCLAKACVNPTHLEPVTGRENARRRAALITHCPKGHAYDERNTRRYQGRRYCRACMAAIGRTRDVDRMRGYRRAYKARQRVKRVLV